MYDDEGNGRSKREEKLTIEDFDLLKVVGKGAFGKVMLVRKKEGVGQGNIYAMKVVFAFLCLRRKDSIHEAVTDRC